LASTSKIFSALLGGISLEELDTALDRIDAESLS